MKNILKRSGFTLIELIIVVAIIALLAASAFVAINPGRRVGDSSDAKRWSDITAIADAYSAYLADNNGSHPTSAGFANGTTYIIAKSSAVAITGPVVCSASTTISATGPVVLDNLATSGYIGAIPVQPTNPTANTTNTGYYLYKESGGKLIIGSCEKYGTSYPVVVR